MREKTIRVIQFQPPEDVAKGKTLIDKLFEHIMPFTREEADEHHRAWGEVLENVTPDEREELQEYFDEREAQWSKKH